VNIVAEWAPYEKYIYIHLEHLPNMPKKEN